MAVWSTTVQIVFKPQSTKEHGSEQLCWMQDCVSGQSVSKVHWCGTTHPDITGSPAVPCGHTQRYDPWRLTHSALGWHGCSSHSFISKQCSGPAMNPWLHLKYYDK